MIFLENRPIFDPYIFGTNPNVPPNISLPPNITNGGFLPQEFSPKDFYQNQYYYYRYLNEYLDYTMKRTEYEKKLASQLKNSN